VIPHLADRAPSFIDPAFAWRQKHAQNRLFTVDEIAVESAKSVALGRDEEALAGRFYSKRRSWKKRGVERIERLEEGGDVLYFGIRQGVDWLGLAAFVVVGAPGFDVDRPAFLGRDNVGAIRIARCSDSTALVYQVVDRREQ
jgi:hypothetical protein